MSVRVRRQAAMTDEPVALDKAMQGEQLPAPYWIMRNRRANCLPRTTRCGPGRLFPKLTSMGMRNQVDRNDYAALQRGHCDAGSNDAR